MAPISVDGGAVRMEYQATTHPYPIVYLRINGSEPLPFYLKLDTPYAIVVDEWAASALKLNGFGAEVDSKVGAFKTVPVKSLELELTNGKMRLETDSILVSKLGTDDETRFEQKVYGVVGSGAWLSTTLRLDLARQSLTVLVGKHPPLTTLTEATMLPLTTQANTQEVFTQWQTAPDQPAVPAHISLSKVTVLTPKMLASLKPTQTANIPHSDFPFATRPVSIVPDFPVGKYTLHNVTLLSDPFLTPIIGTDVLSRFTVWFDFRHQQMFLQPAKTVEEPLLKQGYTGLGLTRKDNGTMAVGEAVASVSKELGELVGQEVIAIDGKPAKEMRLKLAQAVLDGDADTTVTLTLKKGGKEYTRVLPRKDIYQISASEDTKEAKPTPRSKKG